jgi:hypothetical protein
MPEARGLYLESDPHDIFRRSQSDLLHCIGTLLELALRGGRHAIMFAPERSSQHFNSAKPHHADTNTFNVIGE